MLPSSPRSQSSPSSPAAASGGAAAAAGSHPSPSSRTDGSDGRAAAAAATERGAGVPASPLHRRGSYSPRAATGAKKPELHFARPRRHPGASPPAACSPHSPASRLLSNGDTGSGELRPATSDSATSPRTLPSPVPALPPAAALSTSPSSPRGRHLLLRDAAARTATRTAQRANDTMVYLETAGHVVYSCAQCRTHLSTHEDILSKSFHGRSGRAFLFDSCVNVSVGPAEDRLLITGLHSVCDLLCRRCGRLVGWTYLRAYEASQKYKEGKFIIEKIHLYVEHPEDDDVGTSGGDGAAGPTRTAKTRSRSHSWGTAKEGAGSHLDDDSSSMVFEYAPQDGTRRVG